MIDTLTGKSLMAEMFSASQVPSSGESDMFKSLLENAEVPNGGVRGVVANAEVSLQQVDQQMSANLRGFSTNNDIFKLMESLHMSSMRSVSIQMVGKVATKVSETGEQLIKQQ